MSSTILFNVKAIALKTDNDPNNPVFIVMEELGESNVISTRTNRVARSWQASAIGENYQVIGTCCERSGACEGGMLKMNGRWCKPEAYIRSWRNAIKNAFDGFGPAEQEGFRLDLKVVIPHDKSKKSENWHFAELIESRTPNDDDYGRVFSFSKTIPTDVQLWLKHQHGTAWQNAQVIGPRE